MPVLPKPILAIVNSRIPRTRLASLMPMLRKEGIDITHTNYAGHAIELARRATSYRTLVAVGGDGTVCEVATGMDLSTHTMAIIPVGSRNRIARHFGICGANGRKDSAVFVAGDTMAIDVMEAFFVDRRMMRTARRFLSHVAFRRDFTSAEGRYKGRRMSVFFRRMWAWASRALWPRPFNLSLITNDNPVEETRFASLVISNCGYRAFLSKVQSIPTDGAADALFIRGFAAAHTIGCIGSAFSGRCCRHLRTGIKKISCKFTVPVTMVADGEIFCGITSMAMALLPQKLRIFAGNRQ